CSPCPVLHMAVSKASLMLALQAAASKSAAREGLSSFYKLGAMRRRLIVLLLLFPVWGCARTPEYDLVIRHGTVYDGTGTAGVVQDVAVQRDRIVARGDLGRARGGQEVDAAGLAVAPGFIDMLNHS